jgi:hypothetical protein
LHKNELSELDPGINFEQNLNQLPLHVKKQSLDDEACNGFEVY